MLVAFGSWNAPSASVTNGSVTEKRNLRQSQSADDEVLFAPMMLAIKKPRLTPLFAPLHTSSSSALAATLTSSTTTHTVPSVSVSVVAPPQAQSVPTKPVPKCWCPLSAPAKVCYRAKDDRLNPGRAYYECNNIPSCSFFAWRESNDEYKLLKDAATTTTQPLTTATQQQPITNNNTTTAQPTTTPVTPVSNKRKGSVIRHHPMPSPTSAIAKSFKPSLKVSNAVSKSAASIKTPESIEKRPTIAASTSTQPLPYVMSAPISIPMRRTSNSNADIQCAMPFELLDYSCQSSSNAAYHQSPRQLVY